VTSDLKSVAKHEYESVHLQSLPESLELLVEEKVDDRKGNGPTQLPNSVARLVALAQLLQMHG
jgi:hypothetical protein